MRKPFDIDELKAFGRYVGPSIVQGGKKGSENGESGPGQSPRR
jgi:hypothetical protein